MPSPYNKTGIQGQATYIPPPGPQPQVTQPQQQGGFGQTITQNAGLIGSIAGGLFGAIGKLAQGPPKVADRVAMGQYELTTPRGMNLYRIADQQYQEILANPQAPKLVGGPSLTGMLYADGLKASGLWRFDSNTWRLPDTGWYSVSDGIKHNIKVAIEEGRRDGSWAEMNRILEEAERYASNPALQIRQKPDKYDYHGGAVPRVQFTQQIATPPQGASGIAGAVATGVQTYQQLSQGPQGYYDPNQVQQAGFVPQNQTTTLLVIGLVMVGLVFFLITKKRA